MNIFESALITTPVPSSSQVRWMIVGKLDKLKFSNLPIGKWMKPR